MIVLDNNEKDIVIPDYNDLENKPSINGVVLEGNKTAGELGIDIDTTNFYTKSQADDRFQLKGNYLTSIPDEYITETELNSKNYATNSYVNEEISKLDSSLSVEIDKKQNTLVSGTNIKTINGESILGDGNIEISGGESVDLSNYYTKGEVDNLIDNVEVDLTGYATETWVDNHYQPKGDYLTSIPDEYITETELNSKNYATKSEIPTIPTNISAFTNDSGYITNSALDGYATETYVSNNYQPKGDYLTSVPSEYVTETELNDAIAGLDGNDIPYVVINGFSSSGFSITHGNWADVYSAIFNKTPYIIYVRSTDTSQIYSIVDDISFNSNGQPIYIAVTIIQANRNVTYRVFSITNDGTVELSLQETYVIQQQLVSGSNIKTINGESILGDGNIEISGGESVAYLIIKENSSENTYSYIGGSFEDVVNAYNNNKPYFIYVPNGAGVDYYSLAETTIITDNYIQCSSFAHTGSTHTWRYWRLYPDSIQLYRQITYEYATTTQLNSKQDTLVSGTNIKTINGNSILGSGDLAITTDLSNYYTKTEIDTQIGDINTILENIIG